MLFCSKFYCFCRMGAFAIVIKYCADMTNSLFFGEKVGVNAFYFVHLRCAYSDVVFNHEVGELEAVDKDYFDVLRLFACFQRT